LANHTRDVLLQAADTLLDRDGIDAVTLLAVGAAASVSRQAPYKHYPDKQLLLAALAATYVRQLGRNVARAARSGTQASVRSSGTCAGRTCGTACDTHTANRLMFHGSLSHRDDELAAARHALGAHFVEAVARCQDRRVLPGTEPLPLAMALYAATHGIVELALGAHVKESHATADPARVLDQLLQFLATNHSPRRRRLRSTAS
jgi:AcrR family transcriptional regulator